MKTTHKKALMLIVIMLGMILSPFISENAFAYAGAGTRSSLLAAPKVVLTSYCPTGETPGQPGCTASYATMAQLITALNGITGDGTIYLTRTYATNDVVFDQSNVDLSGLGALTIQGGWNGLTGNAFALSDNTTLNGVGLTIINWTSAVTINDVIVNKNKNGDGLHITSYGDVVLKNITSNGNSGLGLSVNNCNWVGSSDCTGLGSVTLSGTNTFNRNSSFGIEVYAAGDINVNNITANNNGSGVGLRNFINPGGNINVTGINTFNNNDDGYDGGVGLSIGSQGEINLNNITANNNAQFGLFLENNVFGGGEIDNVVISGVNTFNKNGQGGVNAVSNGDLVVENVVANHNGGDGLGLGTVNGNIDITCGVSNHNSGYGVASSTSGTLTLNGVILRKNTSGRSILYGDGTLIENPFECDSSLLKNDAD